MSSNELSEYILKNYRIGDTIIITGKPSFWAGRLCNRSPLTSPDIRYPYKCRIDNMEVNDLYVVAMTDGVYGWSLSTLVSENKVKSIRMDRFDKLKKLNEI